MNTKGFYNRKSYGFTLAELLIVVAIIAVLVAIAIPVFTGQLERSRESADLANVRSAYAQLMTTAITGGSPEAGSAVTKSGEVYSLVYEPLGQKKDDWQMDISSLSIGGVSAGDTSHWRGRPKAGGKCTLSFDESTAQTTIVWGSGFGNTWRSLLGDIGSSPTNNYNENKALYDKVRQLSSEQRKAADIDALNSIANYFAGKSTDDLKAIIGDAKYNEVIKGNQAQLFAYQIDNSSYSIRLAYPTPKFDYLDDLGYKGKLSNGNTLNQNSYANYFSNYIFSSDEMIGSTGKEHKLSIKCTFDKDKKTIIKTEIFINGLEDKGFKAVSE